MDEKSSVEVASVEVSRDVPVAAVVPDVPDAPWDDADAVVEEVADVDVAIDEEPTEVVFLTNDWVKKIKMAASIITGRSLIPIEDMFGIEIDGSEMMVRAVNGGRFIEVHGEIINSTGKSHKFVIAARRFTQIVSALPGYESKIILKDTQTIQLESGRCKYTLNINFDMFGDMVFDCYKNEKITGMVSIGAALLKDVLIRAQCCVAPKDDNRDILKGICFTKQGTALEIASTSGKQLFFTSIEGKFEQDANFPSAVIQNSAIASLLAILGECDNDSVTIGISENMVLFSLSDITFITKQPEGVFPNYKRVVEGSDYCYSFTIPKDELLANISRLMVISPKITATSNEEKTGIKFEAQSLEDDEYAATEVTVDNLREKFCCVFDATLFLSLFKKLQMADSEICYSSGDIYTILCKNGDDNYLQACMRAK